MSTPIIILAGAFFLWQQQSVALLSLVCGRSVRRFDWWQGINSQLEQAQLLDQRHKFTCWPNKQADKKKESEKGKQHRKGEKEWERERGGARERENQQAERRPETGTASVGRDWWCSASVVVHVLVVVVLVFLVAVVVRVHVVHVAGRQRRSWPQCWPQNAKP